MEIRFRVRDNGIGMSPEFLPHLYDPFSQERSEMGDKVKGTGLGLPIVKIPFTFCVDINLSAKPQVVLTENGHRKRTVDFLAWEIGRVPIPVCVPGA